MKKQQFAFLIFTIWNVGSYFADSFRESMFMLVGGVIIYVILSRMGDEYAK